MKQLFKKIFHFNTYIRLIFSSLMILPVIILIYFIVYFSKHPDCISLYLQRSSHLSPPIVWPHQGLLTLWFDQRFFEKNNAILLPLMNKYQFSGMISLAEGKNCPISISKLIALNNTGWEITNTTNVTVIKGQHEINDMPMLDSTKQVIFDASSPQNQALLANYLQRTKTSNGWIILYFDNQTLLNKKIIIEILQMIKHSKIPVVLQSQVLRISQ